MSRRYVFHTEWRLARARAGLRFNHDLVMRDGERGLRRYLERG